MLLWLSFVYFSQFIPYLRKFVKFKYNSRTIQSHFEKKKVLIEKKKFIRLQPEAKRDDTFQYFSIHKPDE